MPSIPTVPGTIRQNTPSAGVKVNTAALDAPNQVDREMGQVVGQVGQQLGDVALKVQGAINYGIAADADRKMREAAANFQLSRAGRDDEDNWENEWKEKSDELGAQLMENPQVGPALKRQLTQNFRDWQTANAIEVRTMATKQRINRATERVGLAADEAAKDGDEQGVVRAIDGAVQNHLLLPEVAEKTKRMYLQKIDEYAGKNYIMSNPAGAVDFLEQKGEDGKPVNLTRLTPDQRLTLLNAARENFTKYQLQNYNDLIEGLQAGEKKSPVELQALVASKVISPKQAKAYQNAYLHGNFNTDPVTMGKLFTNIANYDPQKDPQMTERATLLASIATSGFPQNVQSEMNELLGKKVDVKNVLNSPVAKDAFEGIDKRFNLGLYGKFESKVETPEGVKTVVNPKVFEEAMAVKRRVEDAARKFIEENPKASASEVNDFISNVQMQNVVRTGRTTLLRGLGIGGVRLSPNEKKAQLDALMAKAKK